MKAIKIILALVVLSAIGYFVWQSTTKTSEVDPVLKMENQFVKKIESKIEELKRLPDNRFCKKQYEEIVYYIKDDFKNERFGDTKSENEQWQQILSSNLYAAYADKFIKQAYTVFRGSEWETEDLSFIRQETGILLKSNFLEKPSPVNDSFSQIQEILSKYHEIAGFVSNCHNYSYVSDYRMDDRFPVNDVQGKINTAKQYLANQLDNIYVNNCTRLCNGLNAVPEYLFLVHTKYLSKKISKWAEQYSSYNSQPDYSRNLYKPLKDEIELLDNDIYNASSFEVNYNKLINQLNEDSKNAYNYFNQFN